MAESKLATYQLAAGFTFPVGPSSPITGNWWQRNNINLGSIIGRFHDLIGIAGGISNVISAFKKGEPMQIGNQTLSPEQAQIFYNMALENQKAGGGQAGNDAMLRMLEQNQQMIMQFVNNQSGNNSHKKDYTPLYIIGGALGLILVGGVVYLAVKK